MDVGRGDGFGKGKFPSEDGWDTDLVGFNIDVGRYDGTSGVVHSFTLHKSHIIQPIRPLLHIVRV